VRSGLIAAAPRLTPFPSTTLFRSQSFADGNERRPGRALLARARTPDEPARAAARRAGAAPCVLASAGGIGGGPCATALRRSGPRSEEHTSELQSRENLVCRLLLEK